MTEHEQNPEANRLIFELESGLKSFENADRKFITVALPEIYSIIDRLRQKDPAYPSRELEILNQKRQQLEAVKVYYSIWNYIQHGKRRQS